MHALSKEGCTNLPVRLCVGALDVDAASRAVLSAVDHGDRVRLLLPVHSEPAALVAPHLLNPAKYAVSGLCGWVHDWDVGEVVLG
ncbi:hypothetical protein [Streptomyces sp. NPDC005374]|uniref:hypothetical protein n=1 Tax=Streptomyces sp. NPDC005374 TaxID=3364713 RepID=UPI0036A825A6